MAILVERSGANIVGARVSWCMQSESPPVASRLSCGRNPRRRKEVESSGAQRNSFLEPGPPSVKAGLTAAAHETPPRQG